MPIVYRKAKSKDLDDLVELLGYLFSIEQDFDCNREAHAKGLKILLEEQEERAVIFVAEKDNRAIGMVTLQLTVSTALGGLSAWLEDLVVLPEYQKRGIGRRLLEELRHWCLNRNCKRIQLLADKDNAEALDFYRDGSWQSTSMVPLKIHL